MVQVDDFKNEGVVASSSWPFQVNLLETDKKPVASTIPERPRGLHCRPPRDGEALKGATEACSSSK
jgi:hypothetical protein